MLSVALFLVVALLAAVPAPTPLTRLLERVPADSLPRVLARSEASRSGREAAEADLILGRLHYARGEYRQAATAFRQAVDHAQGDRRAEARYWAGMSALGAGELAQARKDFEETVRGDPGRRSDALLGVAFCWEQAQHPERALETLQTLLGGDPGEAGPAALERVGVLATRLDRPELARRARERLVREYPLSIEAAQAQLAAPARGGRPAAHAAPVSAVPAPSRVAAPPAAAQVPLVVQIGAFREEPRARELAEGARRAGFTAVSVAALQDAGGKLYAVRIGPYATAEDARAAGERLGQALGVRWRVVSAP